MNPGSNNITAIVHIDSTSCTVVLCIDTMRMFHV